jgi:hypothetical protein
MLAKGASKAHQWWDNGLHKTTKLRTRNVNRPRMNAKRHNDTDKTDKQQDLAVDNATPNGDNC